MMTTARIFVSAPCRASLYTSSAVAGQAYRPVQVLLGGDAQAHMTLRVLGVAGLKTYYAPAPEIFSSRQSIKALRAAAHIDCCGSGSHLIHARFGPISEARLLKPAANAMFVAEKGRRAVLPLGANLRATREVLPDAFRTVFHYGAVGPLTRAGGTTPNFVKLPEIFTAADLLIEPRPPNASWNVEHIFAQLSLQAEAFGEFEPARWYAPQPARAGSDTTPLFNRAADRVTERAKGGMQRGAFVVLPLDLADPVSIIPDVLRVFAGYRGFAELGLKLVLLPFNDTGRLQRLNSIVRDICKRAAWHPRLANEHLFVARLHGFTDAAAFARLFPVAIVDGCGPEAEWTVRRLRWVGLRTFCLVDPDQPVDVPEEAGRPSVVKIECEDEQHVRVLDRLGERIYTVKHPSKRAIADLLIAVAEAALADQRSIPPHPPAADQHLQETVQLLLNHAMVSA